MLRSVSFDVAQSYATMATEAGVVYVAKPDTVLQALVAASAPPFSGTSTEPPQDAVNFTQDASSEDLSPHTLELNGIVDDLCPIVTGHIAHAKGVVKTEVVEFAEALNKAKKANAASDPESAFNIEVQGTPSILKDESFLSMLNGYDGRTVLPPSLTFRMKVRSTDEIISLIMTGSTSTDKLLVEWASHLAPDFLKSVWDSFFTSEGTYGGITPQQISLFNVFTRVNYALAIFMISRKLYTTAQEDGGVSLEAFKETAVQYRDYAGALLNQTLKQISLYYRNKVLVVETNEAAHRAVVNGDLYADWIASGGKPEVILGMLVSGETVVSQALIDGKSETFLRQWNSYVSFYKTNNANTVFDRFKEAVTDIHLAQMKDLTEDEKNYALANAGYQDNIKKLFDAELRALKAGQMNDVYEVALTFVAKVRFYYTSAYEILSDINEAGKANPEIDVREAALIAAVNYLAAYLANQIAVVS